MFNIDAAYDHFFCLNLAAVSQLDSFSPAIFDDNFFYLVKRVPLTAILVENALIGMSDIVRSPFNTAYLTTEEERKKKYGNSRASNR